MQVAESLRQLWVYRRFVWEITLLQLRLRYKLAVLGFLWSLLRPLFLSLVLYVVFSSMLSMMTIDMEGINYPSFIVSSMLLWSFLSSSLFDGVGSLLANSHLLQKVALPMEAFPLTAVLANVVNFGLSMAVVIPLLAIFGSLPIRWEWLMLLPLTLHVLLLASGLVCIMSVTQVFFRDVGIILEVVMMGWFYFTPVFYPPKVVWGAHVPGGKMTEFLFVANPVFPIMERYRWGLFGHSGLAGAPGALANPAAPWVLWGASFLLSLVLFLVGVSLVRRRRTKIIDFL